MDSLAIGTRVILFGRPMDHPVLMISRQEMTTNTLTGMVQVVSIFQTLLNQ